MANDEPQRGNQLPRVLGPWMATALVVGTVIGSGVFKKPSAVARDVPEIGLALAAWALVGVLTLMGALALAEVAVLWPRAGGNYVFLREGFGRGAGFLWGWVEFWVIRSASIAALATIFTESLHDLLRQARGVPSDQDLLSFWARQGMTMTVISVLALVNARGTRWGGGLQVAVTVVKVGSLVAIAVLPFVMAALTAEPLVHPTVTGHATLWPADWGGINWSRFGASLVAILWSYHGWMNLAPVAEEIRDPNRNIPRAFVLGVLAIIALYVSANVAYFLVISPEEMTRLTDRTVASAFAERLIGPVGLVLASGAVMMSVFGALNGNLLVGPRLLYAMGNDGLAPRALARLHPRFRTPFLATLILAGWAISLVVAGSLLVTVRLPVLNLGFGTLDLNLPQNTALFDLLTDYAMFGAVSFETAAVASIFMFRHRYPPDKIALPYRCRFYPLLPIVYVVFMALVLLNMFATKRTESIAAVGFIALGSAVYWLFFAGRSNLPRSGEDVLPSHLVAPPHVSEN